MEYSYQVEMFPMEMFSLSEWWILVPFIWRTGNSVFHLSRFEGQNTEHR